jgi:hypothetical protein
MMAENTRRNIISDSVSIIFLRSDQVIRSVYYCSAGFEKSKPAVFVAINQKRLKKNANIQIITLKTAMVRNEYGNRILSGT